MGKKIEECNFLKNICNKKSSIDLKEIKSIKSYVELPIFIVEFSYTTRRGNSKKQQRKLIAPSEETARRNFINWLNTFNEKEPYRAMLNAKILSIYNTDKKEIVICG